MVGFYVYPFTGATEQTKLQVWAKGTPIDGYDAATWRRDRYGRYMQYAEHGNRASGQRLGDRSHPAKEQRWAQTRSTTSSP